MSEAALERGPLERGPDKSESGHSMKKEASLFSIANCDMQGETLGYQR